MGSDRLFGVMEDRPSLQVRLGHAKRFFYIPEIMVVIDHVLIR